MAKRGGKKESDAEREARERKHQAQGMLVGLWAGRGLPLAELGITFDPPLSEAEIATVYAEQIELGVAEQNQKLIGWLWESAEKGNASVQMYLANLRLGWKNVARQKPPASKTMPAMETPPPGPMTEMQDTPPPPAAEMGKVITLALLGKTFKSPRQS